jgi:hypothetical protein
MITSLNSMIIFLNFKIFTINLILLFYLKPRVMRKPPLVFVIMGDTSFFYDLYLLTFHIFDHHAKYLLA